MRNPVFADTNTDIDPDNDADVSTIEEALSATDLPDREVIAPERDAYGRWMPAFRLHLHYYACPHLANVLLRPGPVPVPIAEQSVVPSL